MVYCTYDKLVKIEDLKPNLANPNQHPDNQVEKLAKLIQAHGWRHPITVSKRSGLIVSGHCRLLAAQKLGLTEAPVDYQDFKSEAEELAVLVADNAVQEFAEIDGLKMADILVELDQMDYDLDLTALDKMQIDDYVVGPIEPNPQDDIIPEVTEAISKTGDLWLLGKHRLLCGDATKKEDVERLMDGKKADMVFTDPPYGIDYSDIKNKHKKIENDKDPRSVLSPLNNINVPMFICCNWQSLSVFESTLNDVDFKACIVWDKGARIQNLDKFAKQHEFILYTGPFGGEQTIDVDVWQISRATRDDHPTAKPVALITRACSAIAGQTVYDSFLGSGSTLIACEKLNRICYGMEIEPKYVDVAVRRWEDYTGRKAECGQ